MVTQVDLSKLFLPIEEYVGKPTTWFFFFFGAPTHKPEIENKFIDMLMYLDDIKESILLHLYIITLETTAFEKR